MLVLFFIGDFDLESYRCDLENRIDTRKQLLHHHGLFWWRSVLDYRCAESEGLRLAGRSATLQPNSRHSDRIRAL